MNDEGFDFVFEPHPGKQEMFLSLDCDIIVYGGAAGGGKTMSLLAEPLRWAERVPGFNAVIFRRTRPMITNPGGMWDESWGIYPHLGAIPSVQFLRWKFPVGSVIHFAHCQHDKNKYDWKGAQICLLAFDQLEEFTESIFWYLTSRNRSTCGVRPYIRATANPVPDDDEVGGWLNELISWWWDPETGYAIEERAGVVRWFIREHGDIVWGDTREELELKYAGSIPRSFTFIPALLSDNPTLSKTDPNYLATLKAMPMVERERLLGGNWLIRADSGNIFRPEWFRIVRSRTGIASRVRYWDKAGTAEEDNPKSAFTAGVLMARTAEGRYVIEDIVRGQWSAHERERAIRQTAEIDGIETTVWVEQEPGSGGKESAEATIANLAGFDVHADRVTGDKVTRAGPLSAQVEAGNVDVVQAEWTRGFLKRANSFPRGIIDDIDAAAGAFNKLADMEPVYEEVYDADVVGGFVL